MDLMVALASVEVLLRSILPLRRGQGGSRQRLCLASVLVRRAHHAAGERAALSGHQATVKGTRPGGRYRASPNTATTAWPRRAGVS